VFAGLFVFAGLAALVFLAPVFMFMGAIDAAGLGLVAGLTVLALEAAFVFAGGVLVFVSPPHAAIKNAATQSNTGRAKLRRIECPPTDLARLL
jgi:hypothetical protein